VVRTGGNRSQFGSTRRARVAALRRIEESDARLNVHLRLRGERGVDEKAGRLRPQMVVLSPGFSFARPFARRNPGRKVQDSRSVDCSPDRTRVEQVELRQRRSVDLVTLCAKERNRRLAEGTASAGHQDAHSAPCLRSSH
jgi:hypothetical protein